MLSVHDWIHFDSFVRRFEPTDETLVISFQIEDEEEAAAGFEHVAGLASGEDYDGVVDDGGALDVEVLDVYVLLENELPGGVSLGKPSVCGGADFEGVCSKIDLSVNGDCLLLLPNDVDLLGYLV